MALPETTIKDFGGGWNVADSDLNLSSSYQPVSENIRRGIDGSFSPRQGTKLFGDLGTGIEQTFGPVSIQFSTTNGQPYITLIVPSGLFSNGDHITIQGLTTDINGIPFAEINGTHGVVVTGPTSIRIAVQGVANASSSQSRTITYTRDTHAIGGNIIHDYYFNRRLLLFSDIGEICSIDLSGNIAKLWNASIIYAINSALTPTRRSLHWSCDAFKSTVIATNGYNKDKPIQIKSNFTVEFLVDKATSSNAAVPKADYVVCMQSYVSLIRTEYGNPFIEISAKGTDGTFTRQPSPADAVEVDLSTVTASVEPTLLGGAPLRDRLYVAFYDRGMLGILGKYTGTSHAPDFNDTIPEHGTVSHRTLVSLGNDILMCDYAGVPSVSISQASGIFVPVRLSELIAPEIQKHLSSLDEDTLKYKAFAVYNRSDRSYMLFLPKYANVTRKIAEDSIIIQGELRDRKQALVRCDDAHNLFEDSYVTIAGATNIGSLGSGSINGKHKVVALIDKNTFVIQLDDVPMNPSDTSGGGANITFSPVNDETLVYVFEYNKELKIRRWTRYRGWNFDCACVSQRGNVYVAKGKKIYVIGSNNNNLGADFIDDYDDSTWSNNKAYAVGRRVRDASIGKVYICAVAHTSAAIGTFASDRELNPENWTEYKGEAINWTLETPWSDMRAPGRFKLIKHVALDTTGTDRFTLSAFVNQIYKDKLTGDLLPVRSTDFQAGDTGGYGVQSPGTFGSGRRTRERKVWPMPFKGKQIKWRFSGSTKTPTTIVALTMFYMLGGN